VYGVQDISEIYSPWTGVLAYALVSLQANSKRRFAINPGFRTVTRKLFGAYVQGYHCRRWKYGTWKEARILARIILSETMHKCDTNDNHFVHFGIPYTLLDQRMSNRGKLESPDRSTLQPCEVLSTA
jgi:hypothetical protein